MPQEDKKNNQRILLSWAAVRSGDPNSQIPYGTCTRVFSDLSSVTYHYADNTRPQIESSLATLTASSKAGQAKCIFYWMGLQVVMIRTGEPT